MSKVTRQIRERDAIVGGTLACFAFFVSFFVSVIVAVSGGNGAWIVAATSLLFSGLLLYSTGRALLRYEQRYGKFESS